MAEPRPPQATSKLLIRRHVLASIQALSAVATPSKEEKLTQLNRLKELSDAQAICQVLVRELERAQHTPTRQIIAEFLMELADIEWVQDDLWKLIQSPHSSDATKDSANLILRNLGDDSDPDLYLDYLDDPEALITEETERMLQIATKNPESLIDFIDFIFSLPIGEQLRLLRSLQSDYAPDYLIHLFIPLYWAATPTELKDYILNQLLKSHTLQAKQFLAEVAEFETNAERQHLALESKKKRHLTSVTTPEALTNSEKPMAILTDAHKFSEPAKCFATLPDGIGNQGLLYSRKKENGDITLVGIAINDAYGIIDCFGFYQLSPVEVDQLIDKFHEESIKIPVSEGYCIHKFDQAEDLGKVEGTPIPYEYTCWKSLFEATPNNQAPFEFTPINYCQPLAHTKWAHASQNLYLHPDFETWFLEVGDDPYITPILKAAQNDILQGLQEQRPNNELVALVDQAALNISTGILQSAFTEKHNPHNSHHRFINRLADCAYLLNQGDTKTFAPLAATEVMKLAQFKPEDVSLLANSGFIRAFGQRCMTEHLLRIQQHPKQFDIIAPQQLEALISSILALWEDEFSLNHIDETNDTSARTEVHPKKEDPS